MKLPAVPVTSFQDATLNMEALTIALPNVLGYGSGTLTWPGGSPFSDTITVNHGLRIGGQNVAPVTVQALSQLPGGAAAVEMHYVSVSSTQIQFRGHTTDGSSPVSTVTTPFFWLAIG